MKIDPSGFGVLGLPLLEGAWDFGIASCGSNLPVQVQVEAFQVGPQVQLDVVTRSHGPLNSPNHTYTPPHKVPLYSGGACESPCFKLSSGMLVRTLSRV